MCECQKHFLKNAVSAMSESSKFHLKELEASQEKTIGDVVSLTISVVLR
jgi:hypothetical protein